MTTGISWDERRATAVKLYADSNYAAAADCIWEGGEIPFRSGDVAFCVKVLSRGRKEDAMRVLRESMKRSSGIAEESLALASAFYQEGMPLLAARFYGAALSVDSMYFENQFEKESLWLDDFKVLLGAWEESDQRPMPGPETPIENFLGKAKTFMEYTQRITEVAPSVVKASSEDISVAPSEDEAAVAPKFNFPK
ncbi:hypothetical protein ACFPK9_00770 [Rubritalea spongiae]|uniref:Tetratricopeptide repeat protein n=1 Tax=Rubritalea spongiae TaxID=430797 RepID=A0ABW5E6M9_9BACT